MGGGHGSEDFETAEWRIVGVEGYQLRDLSQYGVRAIRKLLLMRT